MTYPTSPLVNLPQEIFLHTASYLNSIDQNSLAITHKECHRRIVAQRMRILQGLYTELYNDLIGKKVRFENLEQAPDLLVLERDLLQQVLTQKLQKIQSLFQKISNNLENAQYFKRPSSKQIYSLLPRGLNQQNNRALMHIKSAIYAELCRNLISAKQLQTSHLLSKHIRYQKHKQPLLLDQIKDLLSNQRRNSALKIATSIKNQSTRREAYSELLDSSVSQNPRERDDFIESMIQREKDQTNSSEELLKRCYNFQKNPQRKKRKVHWPEV